MMKSLISSNVRIEEYEEKYGKIEIDFEKIVKN